MKTILLKFLDIYQKFFTLIGYGSCRYYPTCSEYAKWQVEQNNIFKAIFYTTKRILSCNQLFDGGIDYPIVKKNLNCKKICTCYEENKDIKIKYYLVKKSVDNFYLIKKFNDTKKGKN
jgi:putative membrane protein insertion efficiency factor